MTEPTVWVRPAERYDAEKISPRAIDIREVEGATGRPIDEVLLEAIETSPFSWTGLTDMFGKPEIICVWGVCPYPNDPTIGIPWLIASNLLYAHKRIFVTEAKTRLAELEQMFPVMINMVHSENYAAIRWLKSLGFDISPAVPFGVSQELYHPFTKYNSNV